jgi:hypothetical protein
MAMERPVAENYRIPGLHVGRDATKWNDEVVKVGDSRLPKGNAIEQKSDTLPGVVSVGASETMSQAERCIDQKIAAILLATVGKLGIGWRRSEGLIPINRFGEVHHFRR